MLNRSKIFLNEKIMKSLVVSVAVLLLSVTVHSEERQNKLKVIGGNVKELSVSALEKDFPKLTKLKTSLQKEEVQLFEGVLFSDLIKKYGNSGTAKVKVSATNNYAQILSEKDIKDWEALLAFKSDGKVISTKTRGTFRVVYDYAKYKKEKDIDVVLDTNSVWQVITIEFLR
jgi:hypothetical protein